MVSVNFEQRFPNLLLLLLTVISTLFLLLYLVLAYNNRFSFEDFYYIETLRLNNNNIVESVKFYYNNWHGRWAALSWFYCWFGHVNTFAQLNNIIFVYHVFSITLFLISLSVICKKTIRLFLNQDISWLLAINFSVLFLSVFYFFTFQISEVWWWLCASFFHFQAIVFLCAALAIVLSKWVNIIAYIVLMLCALYIGASSEVLTIIVLSIAAALGFYFLKQNKIGQLVNYSYGKKSVCFISVLLLAFCSSLLSPGMEHRQEVLNELSAMPMPENNSLLNFYDGGGQLAIKIFFHYKYLYCMLLLAVLYLSSVFLFFDKIDIVKIAQVKKKLFAAIAFVLFISLLVTVILNIYVFKSNLGPLRSWVSMNFVWVLVLFFMILVLGAMTRWNKNYIIVFFVSAWIIAAGVMGLVLMRQYKYAVNYSANYDARWKALKATPLTTSEIESIYPTIESGMLIQTNLNREEFEKNNFFE